MQMKEPLDPTGACASTLSFQPAGARKNHHDDHTIKETWDAVPCDAGHRPVHWVSKLNLCCPRLSAPHDLASAHILTNAQRATLFSRWPLPLRRPLWLYSLSAKACGRPMALARSLRADFVTLRKFQRYFMTKKENSENAKYLHNKCEDANCTLLHVSAGCGRSPLCSSCRECPLLSLNFLFKSSTAGVAAKPVCVRGQALVFLKC